MALYLRRHIDETAAFKNKNSEDKKGGIAVLLKYPKEVFTVVGLTLGGTIAFYTFSTYMQKFLVNTVHLSKETSTTLSFISLLVFAIMQPLFGLLSDKIGRKPLLIGFGVLGTLCTYPILTGLAGETNTTIIFLLMIGALIIVSGYTSINAVVKAELFPAEIRALGVGLPYALTVAIFGGTAEYFALWFKNIGHESYFYWYVTGCILISLVLYTTMKDTKHHSKIED
ncbi:MFS transporter [Pedobacter roseus]|uniref:MFS transporter n=1 Tax=Pedobacter roseus TaxID=336820 RepID=UPI0021CED614|nr:MFS transporter [Pedobacter roseus]